jgi:hypothetical protein
MPSPETLAQLIIMTRNLEDVVDVPNMFSPTHVPMNVEVAVGYVNSLDLQCTGAIDSVLTVSERMHLLSALTEAMGTHPDFQPLTCIHLDAVASAMRTVDVREDGISDIPDPFLPAALPASTANFVANQADAIARLHTFAGDLLDGFHFGEHIVLAGGAVHMALDESVPLDSVPYADVDLWVYGYSSMAEALAWVTPALEYFAARNALFAYSTPSIITIVVPGAVRNVQIIFQGGAVAANVCVNYDLPYVQAYFDGNNIHVTPDCVFSIRAKMCWQKKVITKRLVKAVSRGFGFLFPVFDLFEGATSTETVCHLANLPEVKRYTRKWYSMPLDQEVEYAELMMSTIFGAIVVSTVAELQTLLTEKAVSLQDSFGNYSEEQNPTPAPALCLDKDLARILQITPFNPRRWRSGMITEISPIRITVENAYAPFTENGSHGSLQYRKLLVNQPLPADAMFQLDGRWEFIATPYLMFNEGAYFSYRVALTDRTRIRDGKTGKVLQTVPAPCSMRMTLYVRGVFTLGGRRRQTSRLLLMATSITVLPRYTCHNSFC